MTLTPLLRSSQSGATQPDELCLRCCDGCRKQPQLLLGVEERREGPPPWTVASQGSGLGRSTERGRQARASGQTWGKVLQQKEECVQRQEA